MKPTKEQLDMVTAHNQQVGFLCSQWAYLEWNLEVAVWWLLGLPQSDGRTITGGVDICSLARKARDLAHRKLSVKAELDAMADLAKRIEAITDERNLAVHGLREVQPDDAVTAMVTRGKYKNSLQSMSLIRLGSLNAEVGRLIAVIEPLLFNHGVVDGITEISKQGLAERAEVGR